jgi:hypothetical protein
VGLYEFEGAVCVLKTFKFADGTQRRALVREVTLLHALAHENIISIDAIFEEANSSGNGFTAYIQFPFCDGGTLTQWLARPENTAPLLANGAVVDRRSETASLQHVRLLQLVLSALAHVHSHPAVHADVKADNVLIIDSGPEPRGIPLLADFDLSRDLDSEAAGPAMFDTTRAGAGTELYKAPEVRSGLRACAKSDVYSFGVVILFIFTPALKPSVSSTDGNITLPEVCSADPELHRLLSCVITADADDRPTATQLLGHDFFKPAAFIRLLHEHEENARARRRNCVVCFDDFDVDGGLECSSMEPHFLCQECLDGHTIYAVSDEMLRVFAARGGICCPAVDCISVPFSHASLASNASEGVYNAYEKARESLKEQELTQRLEADFETRVEGEVQRRQQSSEAEQELLLSRQHIVDRILTLACPRCSQVFVDFEGCFALACSRAGCNCKFCAYCLTDCGQDAHPHVRQCEHNIAPGRNLFGNAALFENAQHTRRGRMLREFLGTLDQGMRSQVVVEISRQLLELDFDPAEFVGQGSI